MTAQIQRFDTLLPLPSREVSPNARSHWSKRSRFIRSERRQAAWHFRASRPAGWAAQPVRLDVVYCCPFGSPGYCPRDTQNAIGALKAAIDGMVDAGIVPDDSAQWVTWGRFALTREGVAGVHVTVVGRTAEQGSAVAGEGELHGQVEPMGEGPGSDAADAPAGA